MTLIVDASVAIKWAISEHDTVRAMALVGAQPLIAPDLIVAEIANALWKKERLGQLAPTQRDIALAACLSGLQELVPTRQLAASALDLANRLAHPAYHCFYLALAEARGAEFITADVRLVQRLQQGGWPGQFAAL